MDKENNWYFDNRQEKAKWLAGRFSEVFLNSRKVLDVGCWQKDLRKHLPENTHYLGIDIAGNPDQKINLDKIDKLPFSDNEFDMVVCADVLEHLENLHLVFDELLRISNKHVIITLPTSANIDSFRRILLGKIYSNTSEAKKKFGKYLKYYGLPLERPDDRHRWFFSYKEAVDFVNYRAEKYQYRIKILDNDLFYIKNKLNFKYKLFYLFKKELLISSLIVLLEKNK